LCDQFNDPVGMDISAGFESAHNIPKHVLLGPAALSPHGWQAAKAVDPSVNRGHAHLMIELSEQQISDQLAARLVEVYQQVEPTRVTRVIQEEYARFDERPAGR
jgi:hypothetical protein